MAYVIQWVRNKQVGYFTISYEEQLHKKRGIWTAQQKDGYKYRSRMECEKDILNFHFYDCVALEVDREDNEIPRLLVDELIKNLKDNVKEAKKGLKKGEYNTFIDMLIIDLANTANELSDFLEGELNKGNNVRGIIITPKKESATPKRVYKKAPKVNVSRVAKKKVLRKRAKRRKAK